MVGPAKFDRVENVFTNFGEVVMFLMTTAMASIGAPEGLPPSPMSVPEVAAALKANRSESRVDEAQRERAREIIDDASVDQLTATLAANDLGLPSFALKLTDEQLAEYIVLIQKEDPRIQGLIGGLKGWMDQLQAKMGPPPDAPGTLRGQPAPDGTRGPGLTETEARSLVETAINNINDSLRKTDYWFFQKSQIAERVQEQYTEDECRRRCQWMEQYEAAFSIDSDRIVMSQPVSFDTENRLYATGRVMNFPAPVAEAMFEFWFSLETFGWKLVDFAMKDAGPHEG